MKSLRSIMESIPVIEVLIIIIVVVFLPLSFCRGILVDESVAIRAMETQGYSNIEVVDHTWFIVGLRGCSKNDAARFTVKAINPAGKDIECYVCTGWIFKGATIRTK